MTFHEIWLQYIAPNIPTVVATVATFAAYIKTATGTKRMLNIVSTKVNSLKQDKLLEDVITQNRMFLEENAKLRAQIKELVEVQSKVKTTK